MRVKIDGVETTLSYDRYSGARGYQYLSPGNASSHAFPDPLVPGQRFRVNGHDYEVLHDRERDDPMPSDLDVNNPG